MIASKYGMTMDEYDSLLAKQGGRCAICRTEDPGGKHGVWHVDHCHKSGKVRGILCHSCNVGIGHFGESSLRLMRAIQYLQETSQND